MESVAVNALRLEHERRRLQAWVEDRSFQDFAQQARELVDTQAASKGYNQTGAEGPNALFDFCGNMGLTHAEGEIVYKVVRWHNRHDKADLLKIAAWAFLLWLHTPELHPEAPPAEGGHCAK